MLIRQSMDLWGRIVDRLWGPLVDRLDRNLRATRLGDIDNQLVGSVRRQMQECRNSQADGLDLLYRETAG